MNVFAIDVTQVRRSQSAIKIDKNFMWETLGSVCVAQLVEQ